MFVKFAVLLFLIQEALGAQILGIIPSASYAHQATFQPLWRELSLRGHKVTVITSDPQNNSSLTNLTELDISFVYELYKKHNHSAIMSDDSKSFLQIAPKIGIMLREAQESILQLKAVQNLIHNKKLKFDLVIGEALMPFMLPFGWRYQCPTVGIVSMDASAVYHDAMGNIVHPLLNPDDNLPIENTEDMTFFERLMSLSFQILQKGLYYLTMYPKNHAQARKFFGDDLPPLEELANNMSLLLTTTHPIFHPIRPVNLNTISIGTGMHLSEPKPLPKAWQDHLDAAKEGVVYFSLGTNVDPKYTDPKLLAAIFGALGNIPYQVIMKSGAPMEVLPSNIKVHPWIPQHDVLRHRNVKLFITQGGLQSLQESLSAGVPVIGIPFLGDQYKNVIRMEKWGYGLRMLRKDLTKESLKSAITEVIENPKYRQRAVELGALLMDNEIPSIDRAIYWIEYVIRHGGAKHLRSIATGMPFWKFYMMDAFATLLAVGLLIVLINTLLLRFLFKTLLRCICKSKDKKD